MSWPCRLRRHPVAFEGVANPWIFDLVIARRPSQRGSATTAGNPALREASPPFQVVNGTARGDTIEFMLECNSGNRVVRFRGLRVADRIDFHRTAEVVRGEFSGR